MKTRLAWTATLAAILCLCAGLAIGQSGDNGTIGGVIQEASGAPIAGVRVSLLNVSAGAAARPAAATTDAKGAYAFASLAPGTYTVMAELAGFQTARYSRITLAAKQTLKVDFKMQDGAVSSPVELSLNPPKTETAKTAIVLPPLPPLPSAVPTAPGGAADLNNPFNNAAPPAPATAPRAATPAPQAGNRGQGQGQGQGLGAANNANANRGGNSPNSAFGGGAGGGAPGGGGRGGGGGAAGQFGGIVGGAVGGGPAVSGARAVQVLGGTASVAVPIDRLDRIVILPPNYRQSTESYERIADNPFLAVSSDPLATLAVDVDTASYSNVRRFLSQGQVPPRDAVRIEELVNYFSYDYPFGTSDHPITANIESAAAPWAPAHRLVRVGIKAKDVLMGSKRSNLVFLVDVSGSMSSSERLPLLQQGMRMLVDKLTENDTMSIVTYSGMSGIALNPTNGANKDNIRRVIDSLRAEGSTNGGAGIQTAYDLAAANFIKGGVNRVILLTDGDFNVGVTSQNELIQMIEDKARSGVFLSVLGVGTGNMRDNTMEKLADKGHGNYAYIDSLSEAKKVLVDQMTSTFITVAKDVKIQIEFNPAQVLGYRLIGYENRVLAAADFSNDKKDGGDMGSGHTVTALFEVVPRGAEINAIGGDPLRFQPVVERPATPAVNANTAKEMLNLKIRYKDPEGSESKLIEFPLVDRGQAFASASNEYKFAASVAAFGMILRDSPFKGSSTWDLVTSIASGSRGPDRDGYREEFLRLVDRARQLRGGPVYIGEPVYILR